MIVVPLPRSTELTNSSSDLRGPSPRVPPWTPLPLFSFRFHYIIMHSGMRRSRDRPDPVSCQSCRSKKLKCNRVQPCSNCAARGIICTFLVPPRRQTETAPTTHSNAELLERIGRLEAIILRPLSGGTHDKYASDSGRLTRGLTLTPSSEGVVVSDIHQNRDEDSQLPENVGTREDSLVCYSNLDGLKDSFPVHNSLTYE